MSVNDVLAESLRYLMARRDMTQMALAKKSGVGQSTISLYLHPERRIAGLRGKIPSAKLSEVESLANALGVQLWELVRPLTPEQRSFYRSMDQMLALAPMPKDTQVVEPEQVSDHANAQVGQGPGRQPQKAR